MASNHYAAPTSLVARFVDQRPLVQRLGRRCDAFILANVGYSILLTLPLLGIRPPRQDWIVTIASSVELVAFAAFGVTFLRVVAGAHGNATAIRGDTLPFSRTAVVAAFLIPLANLVLPFLHLGVLWRASTSSSDSPASTAPSLRSWWVLWVGTCVLAAAWRAFIWDLPDLAFALSWCATVLSAMAAVDAHRFLRDLDARQRAARPAE